MNFSIIIPVWNGADVINDCLEALFKNSSDKLLEVICVDNASEDNSLEIISLAYPQVKLIHQQVNLGFAGGVNAGIENAKGDVFVLLNQDCIVKPGWLTVLAEALDTNPLYGIIGCTILNSDGSINHTGASVRRPDAEGIHLTIAEEDSLIPVEFVTGAAMAIRRQTWETIGQMDAGFYPAYYEDADYCLRAQRKGIETACATAAQVEHLFSSQAWKSDPIRHTTNAYVSRYRFVCKHFTSREFWDFIKAERESLKDAQYLDHAIGRLIAARHTLHELANILDRRQHDLGDFLSSQEVRQLQVGLDEITHLAFRTAERLILPTTMQYKEQPDTPTRFDSQQWYQNWQSNADQLQELNQAEYDLLTRLHFYSPEELKNEKVLHRIYRFLTKRLPSFLSGRNEQLTIELYSIQQQKADNIARKANLAAQITHQVNEVGERMNEVGERMKVLELLLEYDYRYQ